MKVEILGNGKFFDIMFEVTTSIIMIFLTMLIGQSITFENYSLLASTCIFFFMLLVLYWQIKKIAESIYIYKNFNNSYIQYDNKDVKFVQHNRKTKSFYQESIDVIVIYKSPFWIDSISFFEFRLKDGRSILVGDFEEENRILRPLLTGYIDIRYEKYFIPIWIKKYLESTLIKKIKILADKYL